MAMEWNRPIGTLPCLGMVVICLVLTACAGGHTASKANRVKSVSRADEQGAKTSASYEADRKAQPTVREARSTAMRHAVALDRTEPIQAKPMEQLETFSGAPKRQPQDPIYVSMAPPVLDGKMQQAEKPKGAVAQQIRTEFTSDPIIKLVEGTQDAAGLWKPRVTPSIADVEVSSKVSLKDVYGVNRQTGKPGKTVAVVFEATITSQVPPATYTVSETGHVLKNVEVSKRFAQQVRQVIVKKLGPRLPAH